MLMREPHQKNPTLAGRKRRNWRRKNQNITLGFFNYPISQAADILLAQGAPGAVGEGPVAHIEYTPQRGAAVQPPVRRGIRCHGPSGQDSPRLVGTRAGQDEQEPKTPFTWRRSRAVKQRVRRMVSDITGENPRMRATDPGVVEYNPAFLYHDAFNDDQDEVAELKERYTAGTVSDGEVKEKLTDAINRFLEPIRERRAWYEEHPDYVRDVLNAGTERERVIARETIENVRQAMQVVYT